MSITSLDKVMDAKLKKRVNKFITLDDYFDECAACGKPDLLHRGTCTRTEKQPLDELVKNWTEFKKHMKTIVRWSKSDRGKNKTRLLCLNDSRR